MKHNICSVSYLPICTLYLQRIAVKQITKKSALLIGN